MKPLYKLTFTILISSLLFSCKKYEDYTNDYDFSAVYFGTQKPLRTIVAYDDMQFKLGVVLAGKRENRIDETVNFTIDPGLLTTVPGANSFTLASNKVKTVVSDGTSNYEIINEN